MASVSLSTLRARAQVLADMDQAGASSNSFAATSVWNQWVNDGAYELWDILQSKYDDELVAQAASPTATVAGQEQYALPSDFHKLAGIDIVYTTGDTHALKPMNFGERNVLRNAQLFLQREMQMKYWLRGTPAVFHLLPVPQQVLVLTVWYVPEFKPFVGDTDAFNFGNGWEEYVAIYAAINALAKEESDTSVLERRKAAIVKRIEVAAANRDAGATGTITDVYRDDWRGF